MHTKEATDGRCNGHSVRLHKFLGVTQFLFFTAATYSQQQISFVEYLLQYDLLKFTEVVLGGNFVFKTAAKSSRTQTLSL